ncbi:MAG: hypothetical protein WBX13_11295 [Candidatus Acidiferrales bacterium]
MIRKFLAKLLVRAYKYVMRQETNIDLTPFVQDGGGWFVRR